MVSCTTEITSPVEIDKEYLRMCRPLGKREMAPLFNVRRRTVHVWHDRDELPPPDFESVNGYEAWNKETLLVWGVRTGRADRLSEEDRLEAYDLIARLSEGKSVGPAA